MNTIMTFITGFCICCVLLGFLYMLCPSGNMASSVKYVFCLCFVCCLLGAMTSVKNIDFENFKIKQTDDTITENHSSELAETIFAKALTAANINFRKITVNTDKTADSSIIISKVTVYTNASKEEVFGVIGSDSYKIEVINE